MFTSLLRSSPHATSSATRTRTFSLSRLALKPLVHSNKNCPSPLYSLSQCFSINLENFASHTNAAPIMSLRSPHQLPVLATSKREENARQNSIVTSMTQSPHVDLSYILHCDRKHISSRATSKRGSERDVLHQGSGSQSHSTVPYVQCVAMNQPLLFTLFCWNKLPLNQNGRPVWSRWKRWSEQMRESTECEERSGCVS